MTTTDIALSSAVGNGQPLTMSSREIAELCEARHNDVVATIKRLFEKGVLRESRKTTRTHRPDGGGRPTEVYDLTKRDTLVIVAGYNDDVRARIIDRWMELEEAVARPQFVLDPSDPKVMLACFDYLQKQVAEKDAIIAVQAEQVKKLDRLEAATGSMCISDAAKTLGTGRDELFRFMESRRWIFKRPGNRSWLAYDDKRRAGYMEHDDHLYIDGEGRERVATRALVTAKGLVKLAELLNEPLH